MTEHLGLVVHVEQGDNSIFGWANNPASEVSAHFWAGKDGSLEQLVDTAIAAWAEEAGNYSYLSVETEGYDTEELTAAQVVTVARLFAWGHTTYGWPLETCDHGGSGLTTHAHYPSGVPDPSWGDHPCPGTLRAAQIPEILAAAVQLVNGTPVPPVSKPPAPKPPHVQEDTVKTFIAQASSESPATADYPLVSNNSIWLVTHPARSWVGLEADVAELLAEYGQSEPRMVSGITLSRMSVAKP